MNNKIENLKVKTLLIEIPLDKSITKPDLVLRHLLVDTIEDRNLAEVVEETSSSKMMELVLEVSDNKKIENILKDLLSLLGFGQYEIRNISSKNYK